MAAISALPRYDDSPTYLPVETSQHEEEPEKEAVGFTSPSSLSIHEADNQIGLSIVHISRNVCKTSRAITGFVDSYNLVYVPSFCSSSNLSTSRENANKVIS